LATGVIGALVDGVLVTLLGAVIEEEAFDVGVDAGLADDEVDSSSP
jgi:hypothetical protein